MKIINDNKKLLRELKQGDCFEYLGLYYIKVGTINSKENSVNILSGEKETINWEKTVEFLPNACFIPHNC